MESVWTLQRSETDSRIAGVCGALAPRWRVDPVLLRTIAVLLALSGGIGLVLYAAVWFLRPREGAGASPLQRSFPAGAQWGRGVWTALVVGACVLSFATLGQVLPFGVAPAVVVAGIVWWQRRRLAASAPRPQLPPPAPDTPFARAAADWQRRVWDDAPHDEAHTSTPATPPTTAAVKGYLQLPDPLGLYADPAPVAPPRSRSLRPWLATATALALVLAAVAVLDAVGLPVSAVAYWGAALAVLGLSCLINGLLARPHSRRAPRGLAWLTLLSVLCAGGVLGSSRVAPDSRAAHEEFHYATLAELPPTLRFEAGSFVVDLSALAVTEDRTLDVTVEAGSVWLRLPDDGRVTVEASTEMGQVKLPGQAGPIGENRVRWSDGSGEHTLTVNASAEFGRVEVTR